MNDLSAPRPTVVCTDERSGESTGPPVDLERWCRLAEDALAAEGAVGELTLTFVDDDEIAALNARHLGGSGPTDVLSFPIDAPGAADPSGGPVAASGAVTGDGGVPILLGDVVVAPAVAERQYSDHAGSFDDEIALLVVHGILHVLGHDHAEPEETERMRTRELELLIELHWRGDPPADFRHEHI